MLHAFASSTRQESPKNECKLTKKSKILKLEGMSQPRFDLVCRRQSPTEAKKKETLRISTFVNASRKGKNRWKQISKPKFITAAMSTAGEMWLETIPLEY